HATRSALVITEMAMALVLLVSAGLLLRSLHRLLSAPPGFDGSSVVAMQVHVTSERRFPDDAAKHRFYAQSLDAVRQLNGVTVAAFTSELPLSGDDPAVNTYAAQIESLSHAANDKVNGNRYAVTPDYFEVMSIPLRRGRRFNRLDMDPAPVRPV